MCYFKRLIYTSCSHAFFLGPDPIRKCYLQLAYEDGETEVPCGKMRQHSYTSLRVDGALCQKCGRTNGTLSRVKEQLRAMRMRLSVPDGAVVLLEEKQQEEGDGGEEKGEGDGGGQDSDETLSPVDLSFCTSSGDGDGDGDGEGEGEEEDDGSVSSLSLDGAALSAVGCAG